MSTQFIRSEYMGEVIKNIPDPLTELGKFVYYRTYSRWLPLQGRREKWEETVSRAVNYNVGLAYKHLKSMGYEPDMSELVEEAEKLFSNIYETRQFLSGRTLWVGGAEGNLAEKYPMSNYNCSFLNIEDWKDLGFLFYLLMIGTGAGFKSTEEMASKMKMIRSNVKVVHKEYVGRPKRSRLERSQNIITESGHVKIEIGDSKEGWVDALNLFFEFLTDSAYEFIHTIEFVYDSIRPKGERLATFGGTASGHESLQNMFTMFDKVIKNQIDKSLEPPKVVQTGYTNARQSEGYTPVYVKLRPIHILDMGNLIGANVVIGGVRRTAEIFLMDENSHETLLAKYGMNGFWTEKHFKQHSKVRKSLMKNGIKIPEWFDKIGKKKHVVFYNKTERKFFNTKKEAEEFAKSVSSQKPYVSFPANEGRTDIGHRRLSNNSVAFTKKPSRKKMGLLFDLLQGEGEPAFVNLEEARRRRPNAEGLNPCAEILLDSKALCNLTTINITGFIKVNEDGTYYLDIPSLVEAQRLSTKAGIRMTLVTLEIPEFDKTQKRDRLIGTSLTGFKDAMSIVGYSKEQEDELLELLRSTSRDEANSYANKMRIPTPLLATTVKPEGTLSQVARNPITNSPVSSGLHMAHSPYFIRRIRISADDPLAKVAVSLGWNVNPEVGTEGESYEEKMANATTLVIDFVVKSGSTKTKDDVSVEEQLDTYFQFQEKYTEHNSSNTISVKSEEEWKIAEEIIWDRFDEFVGVSFLAHDGGTYELAPYEAITEDEYYKLKSSMKEFDERLLQEYEQQETELDIGSDGCESGACPIR